MNKTISVMIPVYNREAYIEECLLSILQQSYQDFEIILMDDGSTDRTREICNRFAETDSRIHLFCLNHNGVAVARNKALEIAKGEYLFFIDSDDAIHPLLLENLVEKMEKYSVSIAAVKGIDIPNSKWDDQLCAEVLKSNSFDTVEHLPNEKLVEKFFHRGSTLGRMGGFMFRRDYVGDTKFHTTLSIGEDVYFIYENIIKGSDAIVLKEKGYFWRTHESKVSLDAGFSASISRLKCKEFLWKNEEKLGRTKYVNIEKYGAVKAFIASHMRSSAYCEDCKKLRKVMKQYNKELLPALTVKQKIEYLWALYMPWTFCKIRKIFKKIKQGAVKKP